MAVIKFGARIKEAFFCTLKGQEKIHYVGHSMGTTTFMVMAQERPEYLDKVYMANMLAPVAYVENMKSPIRFLAPFADAIAVSESTV